MWADDLAATFRSFDIFRKLASTILAEWSETSEWSVIDVKSRSHKLEMRA